MKIPIRLLIVLIVAPLIWAFNNCSRLSFNTSRIDETSNGVSGNGDSYDGKPVFFEHFESSPCSQKTASGQPFPNRQIFFENGQYALVRDLCADLEPVVIPSNQLIVDRAANRITYQGQTFALRADMSDYDRINRVCPGTRQVLASQPSEILLSPLDLSSADWFRHFGVQSSLFGSISALPRYRVERTDQAFLEYWRRLSQLNTIPSNTEFAFRVLLAGGNKSQAVINYYNDASIGFAVIIDLQTRTSSILFQNGMPSVPQVVIQDYGAGRSVTVFFTTPQLVNTASDIGISPYDPTANAVGDYIFATAASLLTTANYCSP